MKVKSVAYSTELHEMGDPFVTLTLTMRRSMFAAFSACLVSPRAMAEQAASGGAVSYSEGHEKRVQALVDALMPDRERDAFDTVCKAFRDAAHIGVVTQRYTPAVATGLLAADPSVEE